MADLGMYVYLSNGKLRRFIPDDPPWWARMRARRLQAGVQASVAHVSVDMEADSVLELAAQLHKVEQHAGATGKWYEDETLSAGDWMFFEGRIGCHVVNREPAPGAVLFCQIRSTARRLVVLHGSAAHLIGTSPVSTAANPSTVRFSDPETFPRIVQALRRDTPNPSWMFWRRSTDHHPASNDDVRGDLDGLYSDIVDTDWFRESAPYLAGCALVSGIVSGPAGSEIVVGSPLYVRQARPGS